MVAPSSPSPRHPSHHVREAVLALFIALALSLAVIEAAGELNRLSANWAAACRHLLRMPAPPNFAGPWRLAAPRGTPPCLPRRP